MSLHPAQDLERLLFFPHLLQLVAVHSDSETQLYMLASGYPLNKCVIQSRQQAYLLLLHMLRLGPSKEYWWNTALASILCSRYLDSSTPYWDADGLYSENQSPLLLAVTKGHSAIVIGSLLQKGFNASHIRKYYWMEFLEGLEPHIPSLLQLQSMSMQQGSLMIRQLKRCILLCTDQCAESYIHRFKNIREFSRGMVEKGAILPHYWEAREMSMIVNEFRSPFAIPQLYLYRLFKQSSIKEEVQSLEFLATLISSDFLHPQVKADFLHLRSVNELSKLFSMTRMAESSTAELLLYLLQDFNAIQVLLTYHPFSRERLLWLLRVIYDSRITKKWDSSGIDEQEAAKIASYARELLNQFS